MMNHSSSLESVQNNSPSAVGMELGPAGVWANAMLSSIPAVPRETANRDKATRTNNPATPVDAHPARTAFRRECITPGFF